MGTKQKQFPARLITMDLIKDPETTMNLIENPEHVGNSGIGRKKVKSIRMILLIHSLGATKAVFSHILFPEEEIGRHL